ncbi:MAG TPA: nucleoside recognition domain-containing protein [Chitinophagaceae bacterium]|nr:spore maturation protein [Chitinophagaceae bacterium]MCC6635868.1 spore maturation protein [Chitinophagaceae bacterium]HMZ46793.1 nucleoside recognition domain-containing protein [Chitinophagaceae bacterium]HNF29860.1 nucleoside recognition domain-containing protein [Chitinophagaceae bacterium]HNM34695.1 nucleoside recognition domain-containing protein [Chitinophagaceae bacterium]
MALSKIWSAFIITAIIVALCRMLFFDGGTNLFSKMVVGKHGDTTNTKTIDSNHLSQTILATIKENKEFKNGETKYTKNKEGNYIVYNEQSADGILATCTVAVNICIGLIGIMALFMGFLAIAEKAGAINFLSRIIGPFFNKLFPDLPKNHPAFGHMILNFSANLLNMDNAATPFGIKAMQSLQEANPDKDKASNAQVMFLCLHASGLTLIPITIIAFRAQLGAANPTDIFIPCMIATFAATMAALLIVSFKQKINVLQPIILMWVLGISAIIAALVLYIKSLSKNEVDVFSGLLSNGLILLIFLLIVLGGLYKKVNVFDAFVEGAKGGFETAIKIIPYLVGMLVAISLLRTSGTFDALINGMKHLFLAIGMDTRFVDGLPTALIKPMSGSAARGMMIDTMRIFGADSYAGRLSSILQGSSDTTFYVVAVYFGAVGIKNTRYTIGSMLLADLVGIITAIILSYMFFT